MVPAELRARLAADFAPVRPLPPVWARSLWVLPLAIVTILGAPVAFSVRGDAGQLGWLGSWGASLLQAGVGLAVIAAALRESIPGRAWSGRSVALWLALPLAVVVMVTMASWEASRVILRGDWWLVGGLCLTGSAASALPVVAMASVLAARAYPTRPAVAGALLGTGAGLMADSGWRLFCHFSEPAHVLSAHLGGVLLSVGAGCLLSTYLKAVDLRS